MAGPSPQGQLSYNPLIEEKGMEARKASLAVSCHPSELINVFSHFPPEVLHTQDFLEHLAAVGRKPLSFSE